METSPDGFYTAEDILSSRNRFWTPAEVTGGSLTLSKLAEASELHEVYAGLFWRGTVTVFGMARPPVRKILEELFPDGGWGYTGYSAANHLSLSTQIPKHIHVALPCDLEPSLNGVETINRSDRTNRERYGLAPIEVTILEALEAFTTGQSYLEVDEDKVIPRIIQVVRTQCRLGNMDLSRFMVGSLSESRAVRDIIPHLVFT